MRFFSPFMLRRWKVTLSLALTLTITLTTFLITTSLERSLTQLEENVLSLFKGLYLIREVDMNLIASEEVLLLRKLGLRAFPIKVSRVGDESFVIAGMPQLKVEIPEEDIRELLIKVGIELPEVGKCVRGANVNTFKHCRQLPLTNTPLDNIILVPSEASEPVYSYAVVLSERPLGERRSRLERAGLKVIGFREVKMALESANRLWLSGLKAFKWSILALMTLTALLSVTLMWSMRREEVDYLRLMGASNLEIWWLIASDMLKLLAIASIPSVVLAELLISWLRVELSFPLELSFSVPDMTLILLWWLSLSLITLTSPKSST